MDARSYELVDRTLSIERALNICGPKHDLDLEACVIAAARRQCWLRDLEPTGPRLRVLSEAAIAAMGAVANGAPKGGE